MATSLDEIAATLRDVFPVRENCVELCLADQDAPASTEGKVVLRLIIFEQAENGDLMIRDIKEQELYCWDPGMLAGDVPVTAYLRGWGLALRELFTRAPLSVFETLMPHDLSDGGVLKLRRANTPEDYRDALLAKSRLGKWLPAS